MQADSRALAQRHMWLSWLWGMYGVWALCILAGLIVAFTNSTPGELPVALTYGLLLGFVVPMAFLGLPALLGVLGRRIFMQQAFAHYPDSRQQLLLRTALVFECSVLLCWLLWEIFAGLATPHVFQEFPLRHFLSTTIAFFGFSLPWLLSSLAAAWWVTQPHTSN